MSDKRLQDLIRDVVMSELGASPALGQAAAPTSATPALPAAEPVGAPERVALGKKVSRWAGLPLAPTPATGRWAPAGGRADPKAP